MLLFTRPETPEEWEVPPVVLKVVDIEAYATALEVAYLQVAFSSVVSEIVVEVVPPGKVEVGAPFERTGGVTSGAATTVTEIVAVLVAPWLSVTRKRVIT